jgi:beta-mannosidase
MNFPLHPHIDLNSAWQFAVSDDIHQFSTVQEVTSAGLELLEAQVPGNLELDLQRNGVIEEPFYGLNILDLRSFETAHVWYSRRFEAAAKAGHEAYLLFEGIDCFAEIYLNGKHIGSCDNMLIPHEFAVGNYLQDHNELLVHIRPAFVEAKKFDYPAATLADPLRVESLYVRKAQHAYGWDIMPRALSAGLWRAVSLRYKPMERLEELYLETQAADKNSARLILHYQARVDSPIRDNYEIEVEGRCGNSSFQRRHRLTFDAGKLPALGLPPLVVQNPHLWWPRGRGQANLYNISVRLFKNGTEIDRSEFRHGIRTVELKRTSVTDSNGSGEFCFIVNGERTFIHGTNWVPADAYHSRDLERIPRMLELAVECNCNMIRCWGGNVYEHDLFYDTCDEQGILVWQDFGMGCAVYPQDVDFQNSMAREAKTVVRRLRQHACIALWAGDNEVDQVPAWYGEYGFDPNTNVLTRVVLPNVLQQEDPRRPYLPSSPYVDEVAFETGEKFIPEQHLWGPRDYFKSDYYRNSLCHFASEIGYHGCPSPDSIRRFISPENVWPNNNKEWLLHSTSAVLGLGHCEGRIELMTNQIREMFGAVPANLDDYAFASQCVQAEAKKYFIELFRTMKWRRTGILWWNLIDGWPQFSDAVVDYYFTKKLAFDYIKRVQQPLLVALREPDSWKQEVVACNDTREDLEIEYSVCDIDTQETLWEGSASAAANQNTLLTTIPFYNSEKKFYVIEWQSPLGLGRNHYLAGHPAFDLETYRRWLHAAELKGGTYSANRMP